MVIMVPQLQYIALYQDCISCWVSFLLMSRTKSSQNPTSTLLSCPHRFIETEIEYIIPMKRSDRFWQTAMYVLHYGQVQILQAAGFSSDVAGSLSAIWKRSDLIMHLPASGSEILCKATASPWYCSRERTSKVRSGYSGAVKMWPTWATSASTT